MTALRALPISQIDREKFVCNSNAFAFTGNGEVVLSSICRNNENLRRRKWLQTRKVNS